MNKEQVVWFTALAVMMISAGDGDEWIRGLAMIAGILHGIVISHFWRDVNRKNKNEWFD